MAALWLSAGPSVMGAHSVARIWNERALAAIRVDTPHPPAQARNLFSFSVCMYDAWAAYDPVAVGYVYRGKHTATDVATARREAISYAVYRMMRERHFYSRTSTNTLLADDALMTSLGYPTGNTTRDTATPAGVGNSIYDAVSAWFINDGARQANGTQTVPYPDYPILQGGYVYINEPMQALFPGAFPLDVNRWQRLQIIDAVDQNGFPDGPIQTYLGAHWLGVRPFAMSRSETNRPWIDPGPPPRLNSASDADFRSNVVAVLRASSELSPDDEVMIDISPGAFGNNSLGQNDGQGHPLNPATGAPYEPNIVYRGDFTRVLAEFWADGPSSETPPGHWNALANEVSDHPLLVKQFEGSVSPADDLEWDVKLYFVLNAAVHDAGCVAWSIKRYYDGWRPISAVRYMGQLGQSTDAARASYHPDGLPLVADLIEEVTPESVTSGRHAGLTPGRIAVLAWPGQPPNPVTTYQGVRWIHADTWVPYQRTNFVTPAFPGYVSGHSTFSRAGAEVLALITGSAFFPGGMGTYTAPKDMGLGFEKGPSQTVVLQWGTYFDAADQAGLSRIWGGIHPPADDFPGRRAGSACGRAAWELAKKYWDGTVQQSALTIAKVDAGRYSIEFEKRRGFHYELQSKDDLDASWTTTLRLEERFNAATVIRTNSFDGTRRFHRISTFSAP